mgnify:CR=1 FL=1
MCPHTKWRGTYPSADDGDDDGGLLQTLAMSGGQTLHTVGRSVVVVVVVVVLSIPLVVYD